MGKEASKESEVRNWQYGAWAPTTGLDAVRSQMELSHRYRNRLCELELARRAKVDEALRLLSPALRDLEAEAERLDAELTEHVAAQKRANVRQRGRSVDPAVKAFLTDLRTRWREARDRVRETRRALFNDERWQALQAEIRASATGDRKAARAASGLYWGSYLPVEEAAKAMGRGAPPRFRPWRVAQRLGLRLGVEIQHGMSVPGLLACQDSRLRLEVHPRPNAVEGRRAEQVRDGVLWFRIGSDGPRNTVPRWALVPIRYHRDLPPDARIKWAFLMRRVVGTHEEWRVQLTLEGMESVKLRDDGVVAIDVGWRSDDGNLIVGTCAGSDGWEARLALGPRWLSQYHRVERIASERDRAFDEAKVRLVTVLTQRMPGTLAEIIAAVPRWRSQARLAALLLGWREVCPFGSAPWGARLVADMEAWRQRDRHLLEFEAQLREQLLRARRDAYRCWAKKLGQRYGTCVLERLDYAAFHRLPPIERGGDPKSDIMRENVRLAALSWLREALAARMRLVDVRQEGTTTRCWRCGRDTKAEWKDPAAPEHICGTCGAAWNRNVNAARNILTASGSVVTWSREALAPKEVWTCGPNTAPNRAERRARKRALEIDVAITAREGG